MVKSQRLWACCLKDLLAPVASWCSWRTTKSDYKPPFLFAILCTIKYFTKFLKKNEVWLSSNLRESARSHVQRQWCNRGGNAIKKGCLPHWNQCYQTQLQKMKSIAVVSTKFLKLNVNPLRSIWSVNAIC